MQDVNTVYCETRGLEKAFLRKVWLRYLLGSKQKIVVNWKKKKNEDHARQRESGKDSEVGGNGD